MKELLARNGNQPLYLPEGSVRAIMGIMMLVAVLLAFHLGTEVPGELWGLLGAVVGFYFGLKK